MARRFRRRCGAIALGSRSEEQSQSTDQKREVVEPADTAGLAVPLAHLLAKFNGWTVEGDRPNMWWTLIGLAPSLVGAFSGSLLRGLVALRGVK